MIQWVQIILYMHFKNNLLYTIIYKNIGKPKFSLKNIKKMVIEFFDFHRAFRALFSTWSFYFYEIETEWSRCTTFNTHNRPWEPVPRESGLRHPGRWSMAEIYTRKKERQTRKRNGKKSVRFRKTFDIQQKRQWQSVGGAGKKCRPDSSFFAPLQMRSSRRVALFIVYIFFCLFIIYLLFVYATSHAVVEFEYGSNRTKTKVIIEIMQRERNGFFCW